MRPGILALLLAAAPCALACASTAEARVRGGSYDVEVLCEGRPCPETAWRGERWVEGAYGSRYSLVIRNHTGRWTEAVVTVDGRDVVNGRSGSYRNRGYLVAPYGSIEIEGWRTSDRGVAAFRFTSVPDSYAGRVDGGRNAGVIGVALFPERRRPEPRPVPRPIVPRPEPYGGDLDRGAPSEDAAEGRAGAERRSAAKGEAAREPRPSQNLGTAYGEHRWSAVTEVDFRRASATRPAAVLTVRYDDRSGLYARGIYPRYEPVYVPPPEPPYVPEPPPWRGGTRWVPPPPPGPEPFPGR